MLCKASTNHRLHRGARDHKLHLLSQHGGRCLLLDQVISPVDLQLGLQVGRRVEVFAVLSRAAALREKKQAREKRRHTHTHISSLTVSSENLKSLINRINWEVYLYNKAQCEQVAWLPEDAADMWALILTQTPKHQVLEGSINIHT